MHYILSFAGIVVILLIIIFILVYLKMDKARFLAASYLKEMDEELLTWIQKAKEYSSLGFVDSEYARDILENEKKYIEEQSVFGRVNYINNIYLVVSKMCARYYAEQKDDVSSYSERLNDHFRDFYDMYAAYDRKANAFNKDLDGKIAGLIGKAIRLEQIPVMKELFFLQ